MPLASIGHGVADMARAEGAATSGKASAAVQTSRRASNRIRRNLLSINDAPKWQETQ
jgi:hypothetical protein